MRFFAATGWVAAAAMVLAAEVGCAQTVSKQMVFDVASIRQNVSNIGTCSPDELLPAPRGFHMTNCPLMVAVAVAYAPTTAETLRYLVEDGIEGMPHGLAQEKYDIDARIADSDAEAWRDPVRRKEMLQAMMQTLLAERCKLVVHRELKDKPIYGLVVGKNGPKLKTSDSGTAEAIRAKHPEATVVPGGSGFFVRGKTYGDIDLYGATMGTLALLLSGPAGRPVVDKTGLTGRYDMHLDMGRPGPDGTADAGAAVFSVVQEKLGLKLESQKDQVENLVIDHIERPSPN